MSQAMQFVMDTWFPNQNELMEFDDSHEWWKNNPTTGKIRLKGEKYKNCKFAWVLVKFTEVKKPNYGKSIVPQQYKTIHNEDEFYQFFGVMPKQNFASDMVIVCSWDRQEQQNKNTKDRFDETTPDFFMYTTHRSTNPQEIVNRLQRIKEILDRSDGNDNALHNITRLFNK